MCVWGTPPSPASFLERGTGGGRLTSGTPTAGRGVVVWEKGVCGWQPRAPCARRAMKHGPNPVCGSTQTAVLAMWKNQDLERTGGTGTEVHFPDREGESVLVLVPFSLATTPRTPAPPHPQRWGWCRACGGGLDGGNCDHHTPKRRAFWPPTTIITQPCGGPSGVFLRR